MLATLQGANVGQAYSIHRLIVVVIISRSSAYGHVARGVVAILDLGERFWKRGFRYRGLVL